LKTEFGYYFICRDSLQDDVNVVSLRNWLTQHWQA